MPKGSIHFTKFDADTYHTNIPTSSYMYIDYISFIHAVSIWKLGDIPAYAYVLRPKTEYY